MRSIAFSGADPVQSDWELVERVQTGDELAFDALMARYKRPIIGFVFGMIGDASEAQDVAQDVFVRAYRSIRASAVRRTTAAFSTWLFQVARHAALDRVRRRKRRPTVSLDLLADHGVSLPGQGRSAAEETAAREIGERITAAMDLLPENQRTVVVLAELEGLSHEAIAAILNCSPKSVEARLYRARRTLRRRLAPLRA